MQIGFQWNLIVYAYIHKTVMEMEPQQGCWHARVILHGCVHSPLHNGESIWAAEVVEGNVQLCSSYVTDRDHGKSQESYTWKISHLEGS